jgi:dihydrofolate reductase (trimethoprim resistance protein)
MTNHTPATVADASLPHLPRAVGYRHTMDNTEGLKGNKPSIVFSATKPNPFGKPGLDYSASYPITTETLFTADQMKAYARAAIAHAAPVGADVAADKLPSLPIPIGSIEYCVEGEQMTRFTSGFDSNQMRGYAIDYANKLGLALAAGAPAETPRNRSPYVLGVKPSDWAEQIAAGAPAETMKELDEWTVMNIMAAFPSMSKTLSISDVIEFANVVRTFGAKPATFAPGTIVRKKSGSQWEGTIVGTYSSSITPEGYAVESSTHRGSVQIYPVGALELVKP